jgi:hypothetical protein
MTGATNMTPATVPCVYQSIIRIRLSLNPVPLAKARNTSMNRSTPPNLVQISEDLHGLQTGIYRFVGIIWLAGNEAFGWGSP